MYSPRGAAFADRRRVPGIVFVRKPDARGAALAILALVIAAGTGFGDDAGRATDPTRVYRDAILARAAAERMRQDAQDQEGRRPVAEPMAEPRNDTTSQPARAALLTAMPTMVQPRLEEVLEQFPDPSDAENVFRARAAVVAHESRRDPRAVKSYEMMTEEALQLLRQASRSRSVRFTLRECIQRALESNYSIRISSHNPSIAQSRVVEAEAAFDAVFFLSSGWNKRDNAFLDQVTQAASNKLDTRGVEGGIRQLLPTGMQVSTSIRTNRAGTEVPRGVPNPIWETSFVTSFSQPLLRGFGLDVNRARLTIARADQSIAREQFLRQVRDTLFDVESAYWRLAQARREMAIQAISTAQNKSTYISMKQREGHDATEIEISNSRSRWESRYVAFLESVKLVRDAEDVLKLLINDKDVTLSRDVEIITSDAPVITPFVIDQFAEVRTALDERNEIAEGRLAIEKARVQTTVAKNATLPQLDLNFSYDVAGTDVSADSSLDWMTTNRFRSWNVSAVFSYPIGNRGPRAAHQAARLQESQAVLALQQVTDAVVREVNESVRQLGVRLSQIPPQLEACRAADRNLRALEARSQVINPSFLETELSAVEQLNNARRTLLQVIIDYNVAIVDLEKAKGTLLRYNNVVVADGPRVGR